MANVVRLELRESRVKQTIDKPIGWGIGDVPGLTAAELAAALRAEYRLEGWL